MFIVSPRIGLCNQLQSIVKAILLGIKYERNVYIDKFQINLYSSDLCDIHEILNVEKINNYLMSKKIQKCKILDEIDQDILNDLESYKIKNINYEEISSLHYINDKIDESLHMPIIYLGNVVSLCISKSFDCQWGDFGNSYYNLMSNLVFHDKFYDVKEKIKKSLNLIMYYYI